MVNSVACTIPYISSLGKYISLKVQYISPLIHGKPFQVM